MYSDTGYVPSLYKGLGCFNHILVTSVAFPLCARHAKFKECLQLNKV